MFIRQDRVSPKTRPGVGVSACGAPMKRKGEVIRITRSIFVGLVAALFLLPLAALAQVTTGNVTGRVIDSSGGVIPGAHVALISEAHGNRSTPVNTNSSGDYTFVDVTADRYTIEVTAPAFK